MPGLRLDGPLYAWSDTALAGSFGDGEDRRPVMVLLGPDPGNGTPNRRERQAAHPWIGRTAPGLLTLLDIVPHKTRHAWLHPQVSALGLVHLVDVPEASRAPIRTAAEIVASVAETLAHLGPDGVVHPGPAAEDIGLGLDGRTWLTGFASPWPRSPLFRDPTGNEGQEAAVWRLGVLLALLLGGRTPAVNSKSAHEAMVRRVLIRAMSRPGPLFTERYRDWLNGLLAWEADQRPALSSVADGLRQVAQQIDGPGLAEWAEAELPERIRVVVDRAEMLDNTLDTDVSYHPWNTDPDPSEDGGPPQTLSNAAMGTLPGVPLSMLERDDVTAESTLLTGDARLAPQVVEPGTMPVGIGPPVEALKGRPTIPPGFLEDPDPDDTLPAAPRDPSDWVQLGLLALLLAVVVGLVALLTIVWTLGGLSY